jgi:hypothetical protein
MSPNQVFRFSQLCKKTHEAFFLAHAQIGSAIIPCRMSRIRRDRDGMIGGYAPEVTAVAVFDLPQKISTGVTVTIAGEKFRTASITVDKLARIMRVELESLTTGLA